MRTPVNLGGNNWGGGMAEGLGGFLGLLDVSAHVGHDRWCSRGPCRAPVAEIFQWENDRAGTIGGPAWKCVGLHALKFKPVHTSLGCRERYRSGGHDGTRFSCPPRRRLCL